MIEAMKPVKAMISILRKIYSIPKTIYKIYLIQYIGSRLFIRPNTINLNVTYKCNSKCIMCNIWQEGMHIEITPQQLKKVLQDRLFKKIKHVGITGGEATLRDDLRDIFEIIIQTLPQLKDINIITNAINYKICIERIEQIQHLCKQQSVNFSVMISLDGTEPYHDKNRGVKGSFHSSIKLLKELKKYEHINISIGCTITKKNVWDLNTLYDFLKENGIYGRFRIAEFIDRLNNKSNTAVIRNFNDDEIYHLQLFFHKLQFCYEKNSSVKRTYKNIVDMLGGKDRQIACPYQSNAIMVGPCGELAYCAPKSKIIGDVIQDSAYKLWKKNSKEKQRILKEECKKCIHDYHSNYLFKVEISEKLKKWSKRETEKNYKSIVNLCKWGVISKPQKSSIHYTVFIVGWYGTETVGDKAILASIVDHYKNRYPQSNFIIGSLYPFITKRTINELNINAKIIDSTSIDLIRYSAVADETVMGGGPLMDLRVLYIPYVAFYTAEKFKKRRTVFGCGIGPLAKCQNIVKKIFQLATEIKLRDRTSQHIAKDWTHRMDIRLSGDPARKYINNIKDRIINDKKRQISCFLREWTSEYAQNLSDSEFHRQKEAIETAISDTIRFMRKKLNIEMVILYHMHNFHIGGDDRDFSRRFIKNYFNGCDYITYDESLSTVESILSVMNNSEFNLCMRFHSVVFAHTLGVNFMAIDYTFGGKVYKYLDDNNSLSRLVKIEPMIPINSSNRLVK